MGTIIGVQFQKNGKMYYFDANGFEARSGEYVIVDTARGIDLGEVAMGNREIESEKESVPLKKVIRKATEQDIQHGRENRQKEKDAFSICQKKILEHKLEMKLVSVEYAFDNSKILFFFTANGRVDFRSLVKDLASIFKMRIELRQIGVRDEAKMLGGLGPCGRTICCGSFLDQFQPVSIKMAKEQNLSLNPTKISGVCGRLMCCLKYEQEHYESTRRKMPKVGREVTTPDGNGPVTDLNIVKETVFVRLTNGDTSEIKEYPLENIIRPQETNNHSENVKKNGYKINESESPETEIGDEEQPDSINVQETEKKTDDNNCAEDKSRQTSSGNGKKNSKSRERKTALGQPVKRENPNRTVNRQQNTELKENEPKATKNSPEGTEEKPKAANSSPWADAVEKAMKAINQNN